MTYEDPGNPVLKSLPQNTSSTDVMEADTVGYSTVMLLVFCLLMLSLAFLAYWLEKNKVISIPHRLLMYDTYH
jgi:hypothetical protein